MSWSSPGSVGLLAATSALVTLGANTPTWQVLGLHVVLMISLAALFTPFFTMGLGALPPHLHSHGSSLLGTTQQVAGALGIALVVTVMSARAGALMEAGVASGPATLQGMRWAFAVAAGLCLVVLVLATRLPARLESPAHAERDDRAGAPAVEPVG